jgi:hypothetical protein
MIEESVFIRPSQIGSLDDQDHFVAYDRLNSIAWLFSQPSEVEGAIDGENFIEEVQANIPEARRTESEEDLFDSIALEIIKTHEMSVRQSEARARDVPPQQRDKFSPTWQIGYDQPIEQIVGSARDEATNQYVLARDRYGIAGAAAYMAQFYLDCELIIVGKTS